VSAVDDLVDAFQGAWMSRDPERFRETCAPDLHYEDPLCERPLTGPAALGEHAERLWASFPDVRLERTGPRLTDGQYVAAPVKVLGTHRGEVAGLPATGRFVVVQTVVFCELERDGRRLWRVRAFFDLYDAATQLGVLPRAGSLGERALLLLRGFGLRAQRP
jgi:steroid delta-isomerase-like uncharacterized protein